MIIASFNANGVRARMPVLQDWLSSRRPDVLCLQETKVQDADFPREVFERIGYHCTVFGQKAYNGVAVLSREAPAAVRMGFDDGAEGPEEARLVAVRLGRIDIVNTYVPQGQAPDSEKFTHKLAWLARLRNYFERFYLPETPLVWAGDFNIAPASLDVFDPEKLNGAVGFHPEEHRALGALRQWGFHDLYRMRHPHSRRFTFWDYRVPKAVERDLGWRIDHIWATSALAERAMDVAIDMAPRRADRPSDHTFVSAVFDTTGF